MDTVRTSICGRIYRRRTITHRVAALYIAVISDGRTGGYDVVVLNDHPLLLFSLRTVVQHLNGNGLD